MQDLEDKKSNLLDTVRKRIIYFADNKGGGRTLFMKATGIKKGMFDPKDIDRAVGSDKLSKILDFYKNLNAEWLLTGRGEMLKQPVTACSDHIEEKESNEAPALLLKRVEDLVVENHELKKELEDLKREKKAKEPPGYNVAAEPLVKPSRKK